VIKINNWSSFQSYKDRKPPWIRLHKSLLDNYEYHSKSANARALLPMLWLLASEDKDPLSGLIRYRYEKISFRLRLPLKDIESAIEELSQINSDNESFIQIIPSCSESVTIQVRNAPENVTPETETETETETDIISSEGDGKSNGFSPDDMVRLWNEGIDFFAKDRKVIIPRIMKLTDDRRKKGWSRIKDCQIDEERWRTVINAVHQSEFLSGDKPSPGHAGWSANYDWVVRSQTTIVKILERGHRYPPSRIFTIVVCDLTTQS